MQQVSRLLQNLDFTAPSRVQPEPAASHPCRAPTSARVSNNQLVAFDRREVESWGCIADRLKVQLATTQGLFEPQLLE